MLLACEHAVRELPAALAASHRTDARAALFLLTLFFVIAVKQGFCQLENGALILLPYDQNSRMVSCLCGLHRDRRLYLLWKYAVGYLNSVVELPR